MDIAQGREPRYRIPREPRWNRAQPEQAWRTHYVRKTKRQNITQVRENRCLSRSGERHTLSRTGAADGIRAKSDGIHGKRDRNSNREIYMDPLLAHRTRYLYTTAGSMIQRKMLDFPRPMAAFQDPSDVGPSRMSARSRITHTRIDSCCALRDSRAPDASKNRGKGESGDDSLPHRQEFFRPQRPSASCGQAPWKDWP